MQDQAKVSLSGFELQLVTDANIILTKNNIIKKVVELFGQLNGAYQVEPLLKKLPHQKKVRIANTSSFPKHLG